eukprot:SAG22_NODE_1914_length_3320_cov_3.030418_3_plen_91_part_00
MNTRQSDPIRFDMNSPVDRLDVALPKLEGLDEQQAFGKRLHVETQRAVYIIARDTAREWCGLAEQNAKHGHAQLTINAARPLIVGETLRA